MKIAKRTIFLVCLFFLMVFAKQDINSEYNVPIEASSGYACDLDQDGDNDIVIGHDVGWQGVNPALTVMRNTNHGFFTITDTSKCFCGYQDNIFAIDVNSDGFPDIISFHADFSSGTKRNFIRVYYNSNGNFSVFSDFNLNSSSDFTDITYGDVNGDGTLDLIVASAYGHVWGVLYNDGTGKYLLPEYHSVSNYFPQHLACGDLNRDGRDDIVVCGQSTEIYYSYPGKFKKIVLETSSFKDGVRIIDFDNDNINDILAFVGVPVMNYTSLIIYKNIGKDSVVKLPETRFPFLSSGFFIIDFNNDNLPDVLFQLDDNSGHIIYYNQNSFQLADSVFVVVNNLGEWWRNCFCADLDGNGFPDIATLRNSSNQLPANLDIRYNDGKGHFINQPLGFPGGSKVEKNTWFRNYPNPFTSHTVITFNLISPTNIELSIYDMTGKIITCLLNKWAGAGTNNFIWDCSDFYGKKCSPGVYFAILKIQGGESQSIKLLKTNFP